MSVDVTNREGGPAFPVDQAGEPRHPGMTLRDWFAGQALAGLSAGACSKPAIEAFRGKGPSDLATAIVVQAYTMADRMLRERDRARG